MKMLDELLREKVELAIAPLIDVVFLLLIYFMVTSSLKPKEADLSVQLPGTKQPGGKPLKVPDEQIIEISSDNVISLNGRIYGSNDPTLSQLVDTLQRYKLASDRMNAKAMITISADSESLHQRTVDVLNACSRAQLKYVTFGMGDQ